LKGRWLGPFRVKDRQNMGDAPASVAIQFVKSTNRQRWESREIIRKALT
jgi:hypothetical protein